MSLLFFIYHFSNTTNKQQNFSHPSSSIFANILNLENNKLVKNKKLDELTKLEDDIQKDFLMHTVAD